jgi:hypothetical protein
VPHGLNDIPRTRFALGADHRRAFGDSPQRFPKIATAAHKRHFEFVFVDVEIIIGGR